MNTEILNIYSFNKGDKITRLKPLVESDGYKNFAYVGTPLIFLGIANATIYLKREQSTINDNPFLILFGIVNKPITIPVELWSEGWGYWIEPDFLKDDYELPKIDKIKSIENHIKNMDKKNAIQFLNEAIKIATEKEEFEKVIELKKQLEKLKNNE
jgi:hypothetical protein